MMCNEFELMLTKIAINSIEFNSRISDKWFFPILVWHVGVAPVASERFAFTKKSIFAFVSLNQLCLLVFQTKKKHKDFAQICSNFIP